MDTSSLCGVPVKDIFKPAVCLNSNENAVELDKMQNNSDKLSECQYDKEEDETIIENIPNDADIDFTKGESSKCNDNGDDHVTGDIDPLEEAENSDKVKIRSWLCGVCTRKVTSKSIVCLSCRQWVHWSCANIKSFKESVKMKKTFQCDVCLRDSDDVVVGDYNKDRECDSSDNDEGADQVTEDTADDVIEHIDIDPLEEAENSDKVKIRSWLCGVCTRKVTSKSIVCLSCRQWVHWSCANIKSFKESVKMKKTFQCDVCLRDSVDVVVGDYNMDRKCDNSSSDNDEAQVKEHTDDDVIEHIDNDFSEPQESSSRGNDHYDLHNEEEVYLCKKSKEIFKAKFQKCPSGTTVHGVQIDDISGRFFINRILKHVKTWKDFDADIHCIGAPIKWEFRNVRRIKHKPVTELGTEATFATPLSPSSRKRKRNLKNWQKNSKVRLYNSGKPYELKNRKGEVKKKVEGKSMKQACGITCRRNCSILIHEQDREKIFKSYWELGDVNSQRAFLANHVTEKETERKRKRKDKAGIKVKR